MKFRIRKTVILFFLIITSLLSFINPQQSPAVDETKRFISLASCSESAKCFINLFEDIDQNLNICSDAISKCDADCMAGLGSWNKCIVNSCFICENSEDSFTWSCIDTCRDSSGSSAFANVVNCIVDPCREGFPAWAIILIVLALLALIAGTIFGIYRWRKYKNTPKLNTESTTSYNKINA